MHHHRLAHAKGNEEVVDQVDLSPVGDLEIPVSSVVYHSILTSTLKCVGHREEAGPFDDWAGRGLDHEYTILADQEEV